MNSVTLQEAQSHLPELLAVLRPGEGVKIIEGNKVVARLIAESETIRQPRRPGSAIGTLTILADEYEDLEHLARHRT